MTDKEVKEKAEKYIELGQAIQYHEVLWSDGLYPTDSLIKELEQGVTLIEELLPHVAKEKNPKPMKQLLDIWMKKIEKYRKYSEDEHEFWEADD